MRCHRNQACALRGSEEPKRAGQPAPAYKTGCAAVFFRKEVIQPQVLLRLPCYDFTPIRNHTLGACPPCGLARLLLVQPPFVM